MSASSPKADKMAGVSYVRLVPFADSCTAAKYDLYSITSSAPADKPGITPKTTPAGSVEPRWYGAYKLKVPLRHPDRPSVRQENLMREQVSDAAVRREIRF